jgi:hypothetical protein
MTLVLVGFYRNNLIASTVLYVTESVTGLSMDVLETQREVREYVTCETINKPIVDSAPTAWDFSQVLGNLGVDLGFGDFAMQSWDFYLREGKNKILSEILTSKYAKRERSNKWYNNSLSLTTFLSLLFIFLFIYL